MFICVVGGLLYTSSYRALEQSAWRLAVQRIRVRRDMGELVR